MQFRKEGIMMKVTIQKELSDYMHEHKLNTISLRLIHDDLSNGNYYSNHPRIRWHEPKHMERYDKILVDGFSIYLEKDLHVKNDSIEFIHEKMLGIHRCHVRGLDLDFVEDIVH